MAPRVFRTIDDIAGAIGEVLGPSPWVVVDQPLVDQFAEVTGDCQWIHVDVERAADSSFGGTIVHGYLTLSLLPAFGQQLYSIEAGSARLNYGLERVRYPAPLPVGRRIRATASVKDVVEARAGAQVTYVWTVEAEGSSRPVCVAESLTLVVE